METFRFDCDGGKFPEMRDGTPVLGGPAEPSVNDTIVLPISMAK